MSDGRATSKRRLVTAGLLAVAMAIAGLSQATVDRNAGARQPVDVGMLAVQQGESWEIEALSTDLTTAAYYSYGDPLRASANTPHGLEAPSTSLVFLLDAADGPSLTIIHDEASTGPGGEVVFEFDGLPDQAVWTVKDDPHHTPDTYGLETATWDWRSCCTDGGALTGGFDAPFMVEIHPEHWKFINEWQVLSGDPANPERVSLATAENLTLCRGCPVEVTAAPVVAEVLPDADVFVPDLTARVVNTLTGDPVEGREVTFTASTGPTPTADGHVICTAETDANGTATCSGLLESAEATLALGYDAHFEGDGIYAAGNASAPLAVVDGTALP